jgi:hypothetical protein
MHFKESENVSLPFSDIGVNNVVPIIRCLARWRLYFQSARLTRFRQFFGQGGTGCRGVLISRMDQHDGDASCRRTELACQRTTSGAPSQEKYSKTTPLRRRSVTGRFSCWSPSISWLPRELWQTSIGYQPSLSVSRASNRAVTSLLIVPAHWYPRDTHQRLSLGQDPREALACCDSAGRCGADVWVLDVRPTRYAFGDFIPAVGQRFLVCVLSRFLGRCRR